MTPCCKYTLIVFAILALLPWIGTLSNIVIYGATDVEKTTCTIKLDVHEVYGYTFYGLKYEEYTTVFCTDWQNRGSCGDYRDGELESCYIVPGDEFIYSYMSKLDAKCAESGVCTSIWLWSLLGGLATMIYALISLPALVCSLCCRRRGPPMPDFMPVPVRETV